MNQWTIRDRALMLALLPASAVALLLLSIFLVTRFDNVESSLQQRGASLIRQLAVSAEYGVYSGNVQVLQAQAQAILSEEDVRGVIVWTGNGGVLARAGLVSDEFVQRLASVREARVIDSDDNLAFVRPVRLADVNSDDPLLPGFNPATVQAAGWVAIEMSRQGAVAARRQLVLVGVGSVLAVLFAALLLALRIGRSITRPIERLVGAIDGIGRGDFSDRVPLEGGEDLRRLGDGINRMAERIESAQALMQREIEAATAELREKRAEAERANIAKTRFLAAASHDLRQPIHALGLFVDLLARKPHEPESAHLVDRIGQSVDTIGSLLDSLLDISRLDAGALTPEPRALPLQALFDRLGDCIAEAEHKGLRLRIRPCRLWIRSDPMLLERILRNFVSNALRYTDVGSILIAARRRGELLRIEVRDSGIGIDTESQALVFHEFVQLGNPERNREKGLGLGLAIVWRLGCLLDHPIGLRSEPGRGSVFWVDLPLAVPGAPDVPTAAREGAVDGISVVLIDDDTLVLSGMAGLLETWGCHVYAGHSRDEIEAMLGRDAKQPDLIICDHRSASGENGIEVVDHLRRRYGNALPAVLMSGDTDPSIWALASTRGLPLLHKPVRPAKLRATLRALLHADDDE